MEFSRKGFIGAGAAFFATGCASSALKSGLSAEEEARATARKSIQGLSEKGEQLGAGDVATPWEPFSDKIVRVAIVGEGFCYFGSAFGYQNHPNVEVVACSDLDPKRCASLQKATGAKRTYPSCEELLAKEREIDAIYIATDARSHLRLATMALKRGLHVVSAVPALLGKNQLDDIPAFLDALKKSGTVYQMNETSAFRQSCYAMRKLYEAGKLGTITYTEGEYFHPHDDNNPDASKGKPRDHFSYGGWRWGLPPQYYPTHSNGYYTCVTHKRFVSVSCTGVPSLLYPYKDNEYGNPYGSEYAHFTAEDGSFARMLVAWDTPSFGGEDGRIWGQKGCYVPEKRCPSKDGVNRASDHYDGWFKDEVAKMNIVRPELPPGMPGGGHGGSHGYLTDDFIRSILVKGHKPCVDAITALNTTVAGIYAHMSAMKGGETLKIPSFSL